MTKKIFAQHFAKRLAISMEEKGYNKNNPKNKINIQALTQATECSYQMARKYALGEILPEPYIILKISKWLNVSASWLLFGEDDFSMVNKRVKDNIIEIDHDLLRYILSKCSVFLNYSNNKEDVLDFIMETIYDAAHLNIDNKKIHKIIDMIVASANLLNKNNKDSDSNEKIISNN